MQVDNVVFHTCIITKKPHRLIGLWASQVVFDIYVFLMTIVNAAERPRRVETELVSDLSRDGVLYFFVSRNHSINGPTLTSLVYQLLFGEKWHKSLVAFSSSDL